MFKRTSLILLSALCLIPTLAKSEPYGVNSRVCFIGDSITHRGFYPYYVRLFYTLRMPEKPVHFFNCGIAGGTAKTANSVYEWDIKAKHLDGATIMLGMNDVGKNFTANEQTAAIKQANLARQAHSINGITRLSERLIDDGVAVSFITPSIYDQTGKFTGRKGNLIGKNDALVNISRQVRQLALKQQAPLIDFQQATLNANALIQQDDPTATVIGRDRVHPKELGHLIMAFELLTNQGFSPYVSHTVINAKLQQAQQSVNSKITDLSISDDKVSFTELASSLPFPIAQAAQQALDLIDFQGRLNQQIISVTGLTKGQWQLTIDDIVVGHYDTKQLALGINLAGNSQTPMYQQALAVAQVSYQASELDAITLRGLSWIREYLGRDKTLNFNDQPAIEQRLATLPKRGFHNNQLKIYRANYGKETEIEHEISTLFAQSYQLSKPIAHHYVLTLK